MPTNPRSEGLCALKHEAGDNLIIFNVSNYPKLAVFLQLLFGRAVRSTG